MTTQKKTGLYNRLYKPALLIENFKETVKCIIIYLIINVKNDRMYLMKNLSCYRDSEPHFQLIHPIFNSSLHFLKSKIHI